MESRTFHLGIPVAFLLSVGIIAGGYFIGDGISKIRVGPRTVRVKGLAEREVDADIAVWPISFDVTANEMKGLNSSLNDRLNAIKAFLIDAGFSEENISVSPPMITDLHSLYQGARSLPPERYKAEATITVRSGKVKLVKKAMGKTSDLIEKGVALTGDRHRDNAEFIFTSLNEIKPGMIEEATKNARLSALKFAEDSQSELGVIRSATQGQISIRSRDSTTPEIKIVRVVTTIEYFLK
ncbi:MAG: SIMPL domain-containing protein [Candidatus Krumholzibacteriota bacterium]|nr:SIMPL domain-containing protein [Candidatus Krumholzibacteriota bacterium]